jgi:hypothetical protein
MVGTAYSPTISGTPLQPGDSYTQSINLALSPDLAGSQYLFVVTDYYQDQADVDFGNNVYVQPVTVNIPAVNLTPTAISVDTTSATAGTPVTVTWTVANNGTDPTTNLWTDGIYISPEPYYVPESSIRVASYRPDNGTVLNPGDDYTQSATFNLPSLSSGTYYIVARTNENLLNAYSDQ